VRGQPGRNAPFVEKKGSGKGGALLLKNVRARGKMRSIPGRDGTKVKDFNEKARNGDGKATLVLYGQARPRQLESGTRGVMLAGSDYAFGAPRGKKNRQQAEEGERRRLGGGSRRSRR